MFRVTIKRLAATKRRLLTTALAVVLGVAFMAGTLVLTDTITKTFNGMFAEANKGTSALVRSTAKVDGEFTTVRSSLDASLLSTVAAVDGVAAVTPDIQGYAQLIDGNGKALGNPSMGAPTYGQNWKGDSALNPYRIVDGSAPVADDEIVIDQHSAGAGHFAIGQQITVLTKDAPRSFRLAGIARFGDADSMGGASVVLFTDATAERLVSEPGRVDGLAVAAAPDVSQSELQARIASVLPHDTEVLTGTELTREQEKDSKENFAFFNSFMMIFAFIALFVGSFIIYNTFSIVVAQRSKEMALLRALGASRKQVRRSVLVEALVVGVAASAAGIVAGVGMAAGLKAMFDAVGIDIPATGTVLTTQTIVISALTGTILTVVSSVMPARKAAKVAPVAALRDLAVDDASRSRLRTIAGTIATAASVAALLAGLSGGTLALVGLGALGVFLGVAMLGPVLARPVGRILGWPIARTRAVAGTLARDNAIRNPKRTAATASALMIGVALVGFITIFAQSAKASINAGIADHFRGDLVIDSKAGDGAGLSPQLAAQLRARPEVAAVASLQRVPALVDGTGTDLSVYSTTSLPSLFDLHVASGSIQDLGTDGIAVSKDEAASKQWQVGDEVDVTFASGVTQHLTVEVIYDADPAMFVSTEAAGAAGVEPLDQTLYVKGGPGAGAATARTAVESVADAYPTAKVMDTAQYEADQAGQINLILNLIYAMLGLAIVIAVMGIGNTLSLSIVERTRELGVLRAVGMSRRQLRSTVRWEAVLVALFGTALGLGIGTFFGWAMVRALADQGFNTFTVPVVQLGVVTLIAVVAGVAASILPARRAARLDVLDAIATA
jgi:putative ABC transport system permease protein